MEETSLNTQPAFIKFKKQITNIKENVGVITLLIFFFSILKYALYFNMFSIYILDYLTLSEITIHFAWDLISFLLLYMMLILSYHFINSLFSKDRIASYTMKKRIVLAIMYGVLLCLMVVAILFVVIITKINFSILWCFILGVIPPLFLTILWKYRFRKTLIFDAHMYLIFILSALLINATWEPYKLGRIFYLDERLHTSYVKHENGEVNPFENTFLIGVTENYFFFYNDSARSPEVISRSSVKVFKPGYLPLSNKFEIKINEQYRFLDLFSLPARK